MSVFAVLFFPLSRSLLNGSHPLKISAAFGKRLGWNGEVIVIPNASGGPKFHRGRNMPHGLELLSGF